MYHQQYYRAKKLAASFDKKMACLFVQMEAASGMEYLRLLDRWTVYFEAWCRAHRLIERGMQK